MGNISFGTRPERANEQSNAASTVAPIAPFVARKFDLSGITGLSKHALDIHVSLYEGYVKETNALLPLLQTTMSGMPSTQERLQADGLVRRYTFERNGVVLHENFFAALRGPNGPPTDRSVFVKAAIRSFGSFETWKRNALLVGQTRGIGWVLTAQSPDGVLRNIWQDDHTRGLPADASIVLALDLWEHAYLVDFQPSQKPQYLHAVLDNIDWQVVDARCRNT